MYRSPQKLRSGVKGKPVPLSTVDNKVHRSLSASSSGQSSPDPTTMPGDKCLVDQAFVEKCVTSYLSGEKVVELLVARLEASLHATVEAAVRSALTAANQEIKRLSDDVATLAGRVNELEGVVADKTDDLEQYHRRANLRFYGIEETAKESTDDIVVGLCREKLGVELPKSAVSRSHRVGRQPGPAADGRRLHRPIIVRFVSYRDRQQVFNAKKRLKGSGVVIREDLTVRRAEVYREAVTRYGPRNTWTQDGRVLWVDQQGSRGGATRLADLVTKTK